jgi:hypothetical protein
MPPLLATRAVREAEDADGGAAVTFPKSSDAAPVGSVSVPDLEPVCTGKIAAGDEL